MKNGLTIGVATTNPNFIKPVLDELARHHRVMDANPGGDNGQNMFMYGKLNHIVDGYFVDFAQTPLPFLTQIGKPLVVRLHRIEVYNFLQPNSAFTRLNWNNVSMVFSCPHIRDKWFGFVEDLGNPPNLELKSWTVNLSNMVDLELFRFNGHRPRDNYQMCIVGNIIPKKRIYSLVQMFQHLKGWDLNIIGDPQQGYGITEYKTNIEDLIDRLGLGDRVHFLGRINHDLLPEFFNTQDIIVSNSNEEGTHVSVSEAMACGVFPLLNCWNGVENIYPEDCVFTSETDFLEKVRMWEGLSDDIKNEFSDAMRVYAEINFDQTRLAKEFREFVEGVFA